MENILDLNNDEVTEPIHVPSQEEYERTKIEEIKSYKDNPRLIDEKKWTYYDLIGLLDHVKYVEKKFGEDYSKLKEYVITKKDNMNDENTKNLKNLFRLFK